ncbi:DNA cytosine methyltransferase [Lysinibacillus sp. FSL W7-1291]|uniref:DNA cytosine methyltransferase n=1 Tax=Lysinibacillus sp. FSL W7-1291 TaxID=2954544 RepID=UPI00315AD039
MKKFKIGAIDLFCGVGGLTNGLQKSGIKVVAGIDLDPSCKYAFEKNNQSQFINKSVEDVTGQEVNQLLKNYKIKMIVGCAPCQPFSNYQKDKKDRKSHKDWALLYQFARIVKEAKPNLISMENVPALIKEQVFFDFISELEDLGYFISYSIVNVADFGLAQNRKRLILLASNLKKIELIEPTHSLKKVTVRDVIGHLEPIKAGDISSSDKLHQTSGLSEINLKRIQISKPNGTWRDWPDELLLKCHKKESGKTYGSVYGRMGWDGFAPTITTQFNSYGTGRFGHPEQDRALSLREGALLQSFPLDYDFIYEGKFSLKSVARHIGNAVPPRLGEVIGESILKAYRK